MIELIDLFSDWPVLFKVWLFGFSLQSLDQCEISKTLGPQLTPSSIGVETRALSSGQAAPSASMAKKDPTTWAFTFSANAAELMLASTATLSGPGATSNMRPYFLTL